MGLFVKRPESGEAASLYSIGLNKTLLIIGLGNMGKEYDSTRHNIGFTCLDAFAKTNEFPNWIEKKDLKVLLTSHTLADTRVILAKPTTMMNLSGAAVLNVINFYKIIPECVLVVHDELDITFGQIRTRVGGSDAGHNGIKSIIEKIGEEFGRVRIGIGPKTPDQIDSVDFVLQNFSKSEHAKLPALTRETSAVLSEWIYVGNQQLPHETRSFLI
ncbi:MAG TPA: aminoacyl-tRNA hydrolase [Candidatus Saccharimonadales bacterium]|nr:aminoacyl-tRNA hydrolase [Candidatus Saccharimonadales bacterium]